VTNITIPSVPFNLDVTDFKDVGGALLTTPSQNVELLVFDPTDVTQSPAGTLKRVRISDLPFAALVRSEAAPTNTSVLWLKESTKTLSYYALGAWEVFQ
jgi:hypothetical protein